MYFFQLFVNIVPPKLRKEHDNRFKFRCESGRYDPTDSQFRLTKRLLSDKMHITGQRTTLDVEK